MTDDILEQADALRESKKTTAAQKRVDAFNKEMNRAFKGIVPRPVREELLREAVARIEREGQS